MKNLFFLIASYIASASAALACTGYSVTVSQSGIPVYNPANQQDLSVGFTIQSIEDDIDPACVTLPLALRHRDGGVFQFEAGGSILNSVIQASSFIENVGPDSILLSQTARQRIIEGEPVTLNGISVPVGQFVPPGNYQLPLKLELDDTEIATTLSDINVVPGLLFVGEYSDGKGKIDFGSLSQNTFEDISFMYKTNTPLSVTAVSDNNGQLEHKDPNVPTTIPYTAYLSGSQLDLDGSSTIDLPYQGDVVAAENLRVEVLYDQPVFSGRYTDVLTLSFVSF